MTDSGDEQLKEIEVTTYRIDEKYSDKRHPDKIEWAMNIEDDLSRRDFTINAIAAFPVAGDLKIIDPFFGQNDLDKKIIRAVGNAEDRFNEDALRMIRAVRFATIFGFNIEPDTNRAIIKNSPLLQFISKERIRDEFLKIIMADNASQGIDFLKDSGLLKFVLPELEEGCGVDQNKHHIYNCYEHSVRSLAYAAKNKFNQNVRIAALLHDIGKPRSKQGDGESATFYGHEIIGAKMVFQALSRLRFPKRDIEKIVRLARYHLFYYNVGEVSEASVRRLVGRMGLENMEELLQVRMADRIGSGVPKAEPYKLRHLKYVIERVSSDPISVKMLEVNGQDVMDILKIKSGVKIGWILEILLGLVLIEPKNNNKEFLQGEIMKLGEMKDDGLKAAAEQATAEREKIETKKDEMTKRKYWVT
ncbi:MAG: PolyA polymerase family protein [Parcubacteria group bacterium GW2011_GWC2_39_11]|nr:MAG: PolyA polymerase family protein [Parcubacteria group bacterium GW2011_GWC2_39_11]